MYIIGGSFYNKDIDCNEYNEDNTKCAICYENYIEHDVVSLFSCNHFFHSTCIEQHNQTDDRCPICRYPSIITDIEKRYIERTTYDSKSCFKLEPFINQGYLNILKKSFKCYNKNWENWLNHCKNLYSNEEDNTIYEEKLALYENWKRPWTTCIKLLEDEISKNVLYNRDSFIKANPTCKILDLIDRLKSIDFDKFDVLLPRPLDWGNDLPFWFTPIKSRNLSLMDYTWKKDINKKYRNNETIPDSISTNVSDIFIRLIEYNFKLLKTLLDNKEDEKIPELIKQLKVLLDEYLSRPITHKSLNDIITELYSAYKLIDKKEI